MASLRFSASRVCSILAGDDGELDYMFPGRYDDLEMGEMDMNESEVVTDFLEQGADGDTDEEGSGSDVDFLDRGGDGDTDEGGSGMDEGGEWEWREYGGRRGGEERQAVQRWESCQPVRRTQPCAKPQKGGARGRGGRRGGGRRASRPTQDDREWASSGAPVDIAPFTQVVGPTFTVHEDPARIFLRLFTPELLELEVAETNRFALHCSMESSREPPPTPWMTNVDEMKAFIGFTILMGVVKLPDLYDYWSSREVLHCFPVASRISRKRFLELRRHLHFVDNDSLSAGRRGTTALGKCVPQSKLCGTPSLKHIHPIENVPLMKQWLSTKVGPR